MKIYFGSTFYSFNDDIPINALTMKKNGQLIFLSSHPIRQFIEKKRSGKKNILKRKWSNQFSSMVR